MKRIIPALAGILMLASCATPKYSYNFDYYDYNSGKKKAEKVFIAEASAENNTSTTAASPLLINEEELVANASPEVTPAPVKTVAEKNVVEKKYSEMTKSEKKEFRKALKTEMKNYMKARKDGHAVNDTKMMDHDLKLAIIFGAVALTLSFFGGVNSVFWVLSVVSLVIAVVFFVKWIVRQ